MIAAAGIATGLLLLLAAQGGISRLKTKAVPAQGVLVSLFVVQGIARGRIYGSGFPRVSVAIWVLSSLLLVGLLVARNRSSSGLMIIGFGIALNLLVVLANGSMPVFSEHVPAAHFYSTAGEATLLSQLADCMPLGLASMRFLLSPGDVLLFVGATAFLQEPEDPATALDSSGRTW